MANINTKTKEITKTEVRYITTEGLVFTSREDYLDYMEGLRN